MTVVVLQSEMYRAKIWLLRNYNYHDAQDLLLPDVNLVITGSQRGNPNYGLELN
jgi:hypothetical protein